MLLNGVHEANCFEGKDSGPEHTKVKRSWNYLDIEQETKSKTTADQELQWKLKVVDHISNPAPDHGKSTGYNQRYSSKKKQDTEKVAGSIFKCPHDLWSQPVKRIKI